MTDITPAMNAYREAARVLWNNALRPGADFDRIDVFAAMSRLLFDELVLRPIGRSGAVRLSETAALSFLRVMPSTDPLPAMVSRPSQDGNHYWDAAASLRCKGLVLAFIDFFDWDQRTYIDLQYYRTKIVSSDEEPQFVGREALVDVHNARVHYEGSDGRS